MRRLTQQLLSLCLTGALLLPLCWGNDDDYDYYDTTPSPDYDYNATFDYYYSNVSGVNYELFEVLNNDRKTSEAGTIHKSREAGMSTLLLILSLSVHQLRELL